MEHFLSIGHQHLSLWDCFFLLYLWTAYSLSFFTSFTKDQVFHRSDLFQFELPLAGRRTPNTNEFDVCRFFRLYAEIHNLTKWIGKGKVTICSPFYVNVHSSWKQMLFHYFISGVSDLSSNPFMQLFLDFKSFEAAVLPTQSFKQYKMILL